MELRFGDFVKAVSYWSQLADPDGTESEADHRFESRRVHHSKSFDGRWFLDGLFDPISGSIIDSELRRLSDEMFAAEWPRPGSESETA